MPFRRLAHPLAMLSLLAFGAAEAAPLAVVEAVQAPAWLMREGRKLPLAPGMEVKSSDRIATGSGARVYVHLAEGSTVKLGEQTEFTFYSRSQKPKANFRAALDVSSGAFRYTTDGVEASKQRDIIVRIGRSTIGVRGNDIWGRSNTEGEAALLLEGKMEIQRGAASVNLDQPMSRYAVTAAGEVQAPVQVDSLGMVMDVRETQIQSGDGAARRDGEWEVLLGNVATQEAALALYDRAHAAGYGARIKVGKQAGQRMYSVYLPGLVSAEDAETVAERVKLALNSR